MTMNEAGKEYWPIQEEQQEQEQEQEQQPADPDEVDNTSGLIWEGVQKQAEGENVPLVTTDGVRAYLQRIGKVPLLEAEEEVDLAKTIEVGLFAGHKIMSATVTGKLIEPQRHRDLRLLERQGEVAKSKMLEANLRLVVSVARHYRGKGLPLLDLIQEGNIGLVRAVEKFDYTKGFKFSTYGTWWIRQAVTRALADQSSTIRKPVHVFENMSKVAHADRELHVTLGREPTDDELAAQTGLTPEKVAELKGHARKPISFEVPVGDDGTGKTIGDSIEDRDALNPADAVSFTSMREQLGDLLATLSTRERDIISRRYGLADGQRWTLEKIGEHYSLSSERIRQIEAKTILKLKDLSREQSLRDYLEP